MSATVEERVARFGAELTFENQQFERNVQTSLNTLAKLKEALNFKGCEASFDDVAKAADNFHLDKISSGVDQLTKRFSIMGIIGMTNIMDLTRAVRSKLVGAVSTVTNKIVEGGKRRAMNVEQARFLLQGLMSDSAEIEEIMKNAKDSVTDTAYGYDQAAMAAAQFATSGVKAGEQMSRTLAGVAGVAATTNSAYSSISEIFTQVAGKGRLMGDELLQLSSRGLNAAAIIAKYFNNVQNGSVNATDSVKASIKELSKGLEVSEGDIRDWTSKGKINFDIFSSAMSETFGKHAKDANKTLTGVLSNVNARFSQIGEKFVTPLIQQEGPLVSFFNTIKDKLAEVRDNIDPLANLFDGVVIKGLSELESRIKNIPVQSFFDKFNGGIKALTSALSPDSFVSKDAIEALGLNENQLSALGKSIRGVAREHGVSIDEMIKADGKFLDTLKRGWLTFDIFKEALNRTFGEEETKKTVDNASKIRDAALAVIRGDYGDGTDRIANLTKAGFDAKAVQDYVDKVREAAGGTWNFTDAMLDAIDAETGSAEALTDLSDKQLKNKGYTDEQIQGLKELAKAAKETGTPLNELLEKAKDPFYGVKLIVESASNVLSNFGKVAEIAKSAFSEVFPPVMFAQITGFLVRINEFSKSLKISDENADKLKRTFVGVLSAVKIWFDIASAKFQAFAPIAVKIVSGLFNGFLSITAVVGDFISEFAKASRETKLFENIFGGVAFVINAFVDAAGLAIKAVGSFVSKISDFVAKHKIITSALSVLEGLFERVGAAIQSVQKSASIGVKLPGIDALVKSFSALRKTVGDKVIGPAIERITKFFSGKSIKLPKLSPFLDALKKIADFLSSGIAKGLDLVNKKLSKFNFDKFVNSIGKFIDKIKTDYGIPVFEKLIKAFETIRGHLPSLEQVGQFLTNLFNIGVNNYLEPFIETIGTLFKTLADNVGAPAIKELSDFISELLKNGPSLDSFVNLIKDLYTLISSNISIPAFTEIMDFISFISGYIYDFSASINIMQWLLDAISSITHFSIFEKLADGLAKFTDMWIAPWLYKFFDFVNALYYAENLSGFIRNINEAADGVDRFSAAASAEGSFPGFTRLHDIIDKIKQLILGRWIETYNNFINSAKEFWNAPGLEKLKTIFEKIKTAVSELDPETVYMWVARISTLLTALTIRKTIAKIGDAFEGVGKAFAGVGESFKRIGDAFAGIGNTFSAGIKNVFDSLTGVINTYKKSIKANILLKIAASILIVAGAILILSKIPSDKFIEVGALLGVLAFSLSIIYATIAVFSRFGDMKGAGSTILSFALAMVIIGFAIEKVASLNADQLLDGGSVIAAILMVLAFALRFMNGLNFNPAAVVMPITFALAIGTLAVVMAGVGALMLKFQGMIERGFVAVTATMGIMATCLKAIDGISFSPAALAAPLAFTAGLLLLALDIIVFAMIPEQMLTLAGERIAMLGGALLLATYVLGISGVSPAEAAAPLALTAALILLAADIVIFGALAMTPLFAAGAASVTVALFVVAAAAGLMARIGKDSKMALASALAPLALVAAVTLLAGAIIALGIAANYGDIELGQNIVMFVLLGVMMAALFVDKFLSNVKIPIGSLLGAIILVTTTGLLALAIVGLGKLAKPEDINEGVVLIGMAAAALVIVAGAFSSMTFNPAMIVGPILYTLALVTLMSVMVLLSAVPWQVTFKALGSCLAAAISLFIVAKAFDNIKVQPEAIAVLVLYILMVALLVESIVRIGSMNKEQAIQGVVGVAVSLIALSAAIGVLGAVAPKLDMIAASFIKLSVGFIALGAAVILASVGFAIIAYGIQQISNVDPAVIATALIGLAAAIALIGFAAGMGAAPLLAVGAAFIMVGAGALLLAGAIAILTGTIPAIVDGIKQLGESFMQLGQDIANGAAAGILGGAPSFVGGIVNMAKAGFDAFTGFFGINSPSRLMAAMSMFIPIGAGAGIDAGAAIPAQSMTNMSNGMLGSFTSSMFGEGGIAALSSGIPGAAAAGISQNSSTGTAGINSFADQLKQQYSSDLFGDDFWASASSQIGSQTAAGIEQNSGEAGNAMEDLNSLLEGKFNASDFSSYFDTGALIPENIANGVTSGSGDLESSYTDILDQLGASGIDFASSDSVINIGETWDNSEATGLKSNSKKVEDAAEAVAKNAANGAKSAKSKFQDVGENLSRALASGIRNGQSSAINAAADVARRAYAAAKSTLKINSPSKLFVALGEGIDEGFVLGMDNKAKTVTRTSSQVAYSIVDAAKKPLDQLADLMSGDIITDPTITPVMDLSEIQNGANRLYSMLPDSERLSFNGNIDLANAASYSVSRDQRRKQESDDRMMGSLIDAINGLTALIGNTGNVYNVNGVTYDDGSNVSTAVRSLIRAAKVEGRA